MRMRLRCYFIFGKCLHDADVYVKNFRRVHGRYVFVYHDRNLKIQNLDRDMDRRRNLLIDASFLKRADIELLVNKYSGYEFRFVLIGYNDETDDRIIHECAYDIIRWPDINRKSEVSPKTIPTKELVERLNVIGIKEQNTRVRGRINNNRRRR